jgi:hypothetical protein
VLCELLKTVSFPKSEFIKDKIKLKKATITKTSCKKDKDNMFWLICLLLLLRSLIEIPQSKNESNTPKNNE